MNYEARISICVLGNYNEDGSYEYIVLGGEKSSNPKKDTMKAFRNNDAFGSGTNMNDYENMTGVRARLYGNVTNNSWRVTLMLGHKNDPDTKVIIQYDKIQFYKSTTLAETINLSENIELFTGGASDIFFGIERIKYTNSKYYISYQINVNGNIYQPTVQYELDSLNKKVKGAYILVNNISNPRIGFFYVLQSALWCRACNYENPAILNETNISASQIRLFPKVTVYTHNSHNHADTYVRTNGSINFPTGHGFMTSNEYTKVRYNTGAKYINVPAFLEEFTFGGGHWAAGWGILFDSTDTDRRFAIEIRTDNISSSQTLDTYNSDTVVARVSYHDTTNKINLTVYPQSGSVQTREVTVYKVPGYPNHLSLFLEYHHPIGDSDTGYIRLCSQTHSISSTPNADGYIDIKNELIKFNNLEFSSRKVWINFVPITDRTSSITTYTMPDFLVVSGDANAFSYLERTVVVCKTNYLTFSEAQLHHEREVTFKDNQSITLYFIGNDPDDEIIVTPQGSGLNKSTTSTANAYRFTGEAGTYYVNVRYRTPGNSEKSSYNNGNDLKIVVERGYLDRAVSFRKDASGYPILTGPIAVNPSYHGTILIYGNDPDERPNLTSNDSSVITVNKASEHINDTLTTYNISVSDNGTKFGNYTLTASYSDIPEEKSSASSVMVINNIYGFRQIYMSSSTKIADSLSSPYEINPNDSKTIHVLSTITSGNATMSGTPTVTASPELKLASTKAGNAYTICPTVTGDYTVKAELGSTSSLSSATTVLDVSVIFITRYVVISSTSERSGQISTLRIPVNEPKTIYIVRDDTDNPDIEASSELNMTSHSSIANAYVLNPSKIGKYTIHAEYPLTNAKTASSATCVVTVTTTANFTLNYSGTTVQEFGTIDNPEISVDLNDEFDVIVTTNLDTPPTVTLMSGYVVVEEPIKQSGKYHYHITPDTQNTAILKFEYTDDELYTGKRINLKITVRKVQEESVISIHNYTDTTLTDDNIIDEIVAAVNNTVKIKIRTNRSAPPLYNKSPRHLGLISFTRVEEQGDYYIHHCSILPLVICSGSIAFYYNANSDFTEAFAVTDFTASMVIGEYDAYTLSINSAYVVLQRTETTHWHLALMLDANGNILSEEKVKVLPELKEAVLEYADNLTVSDDE